MEIMEVILLIVGGIIFIVSFLVPERKDKISEQNKELAKEEITAMVNSEMEHVRNHVDDVVDEAVAYAVEKTERSLERISNEKIMAVNEYSETVLSEIHKNHEEAMFLYDMLNSKHTNIKNTVSEVNRTMKEAEKTVTEFQTKMTEERIDESARQPVEPKEDQLLSSKEIDIQDTEINQTKSNNNEKILELFESGKSKIEIAKELGLGVGEVKLVIDLFHHQ